GPSNLNGRVTGIACDPGDPRRVFASTVGGLWRSIDEARTWERVSDRFGAVCFGAVAVNPDDGSEVFAGQGDPNLAEIAWGGDQSGVYQSTSGGDPASWARIGPPELDHHYVSRIRVGPAPDHDLYVASDAGL